MTKDLYESYHNFSNGENRFLTLWVCRSWIWQFWSSNGENRCWTKPREMIRSRVVAQQYSRLKNSSAVMNLFLLQQLWFGTILTPIASNSTPTTPANEDSTKKSHEYWWIIDEMMKDSVCEIVRKWENCEIWSLDLRKWNVIMRNSYD